MDGVISLPSATHKSPEVDISSFFRGGGSDTKTSSPVNASSPENVASPPMRSNTLSPAVPPPPTQNAPGQPDAGPHPHVQHHPHQQPQQQFPPSFVPSMRNPSVGGGPRSPSIARAMPNGAPGRPPVNSGPPGPNNSNMPSPRLAPPQPHVPHQHQHQGQPAPVQGMPHMPTVPGWPGYYVSAQDSADAPEASSAGTPPHLCLESRLDCNVSTFVPSHAPPPVQRQSKIKITDASGHEIDLDRLRKHGATPSTASSTPASDKIGRRAAIRLETEEARLKRIEEERQQKEKEEGEERKRRQTKETEERKRREEEEKAKAAEEARIKAEEERKRKEEEEQRRKEEEEKECARLEEECKRKEEEQKREEDEENDCVKLKELGKKISSEAAINPALSALATARHIQDVYHVPYPEGIVSPKPELNMSAKDGKFRYDRDFLLQFMSVCKQKPGEFPDLVAMGLKPIDPSHVKHRVSPRQRDISQGIDTTSKNSTCRFSVGPKVRSEERIARSTLFGGKPNPLHSSGSHTPSIPWSSVRLRSSEIEDNEVRTLINKLSMEDFEFTSNQIIVWVNKRKNIVWVNERENERVGRSLIQVIRLVFEKAVNEAAWSEMYARLCQKMMEQISPDIQDDGFCDVEDGPISGDLLFREYLLNRCQEVFEGTWSAKEMTAAVAKEKKTGKKAVNDTSEENEDADGDIWLYWDEHNAALEAKHQALRLVKFVGELFKLQMLPDHIMHECIKKLLSSVDDPDEEEIECLCALLTNIGQALDTSKARGHMAIYFTRMKVLSRSSKVQSHVQAMLQDVIELRERKWIPRNADTACPLQDHNKVRALLNKLTKEKFESISNQIIAWANKSENEKDGRTLIQVVRLVLEKAKDEADSNEMYARLCRKMMKQISPNIQDDGIRNGEGKPITGGLLFRKYLLNRCQEDLKRGWSAGKATVAPAKETENQAVENADEKNREEYGEVSLYSDDYFAVSKARRQGLGLIKFIGELYKLQMLTERIMHGCIKKLLNNEDNRKEEEIESLCKLLSTVGQALDTSKARGHMDVYFTRMKELARSSNVSSRRMQLMLQDVIELRERKWIPRNAAAAYHSSGTRVIFSASAPTQYCPN
ncbi:hypothetical protein ACEPAI_8392 [Sanghuangporus weigelae]